MATVLAVLCSGRKKGYTSELLAAAIGGLQEVEHVQVECVHLFDYSFGPCRSCFNCIRDPAHVCVQDDDMGQRGEGALFKKVMHAHGLFLADPVHFWGPTAICHLFIERLYPTLWSGRLDGMPFASVSCATNQGMHLLATKDICKWVMGLGMRYIGSVSAHAAYFARAKEEVRELGKKLGESALRDEQEGREPHGSDEARFLAYMETPWRVLKPYLQNLTNDTFELERSILDETLREGTFINPEAVELLKNSRRELEAALRCYENGDRLQATRHLAKASAFWTHATWKEFLENQVIRSSPPQAYRPIAGMSEDC